MQLSHKINFNLLVISFLEEYESMYQEASADVTKYLANPINAYLLVKRLTSDWRQVEGVMTQNVGPGMLIELFPSLVNSTYGSCCYFQLSSTTLLNIVVFCASHLMKT